MSICDAIAGRNQVSFSYDGHLRVVQPAAHGTTSKGKEAFRGYQVGGSSPSGVVPDWRLFTIAKVTGLTISDKTFDDAPRGYQKNDVQLTIHCQL